MEIHGTELESAGAIKVQISEEHSLTRILFKGNYDMRYRQVFCASRLCVDRTESAWNLVIPNQHAIQHLQNPGAAQS